MKIFKRIMMILKKTYSFLLIVLVSFTISTCTEPFEIEDDTFENILVVNAILTDEVKQQEVLLSRTFSLKAEESELSTERNATVKVVDDLQNEYIFQETDPGKYVSTAIFSAQPGRTYQLLINTNDGKSYTSNPETLPQSVQIDNLYAERMVNDDEIEGVGIFIDSSDPTGISNFYRYEYEETYKIIAPSVITSEFRVVSESPLALDLFPTTEERVCYKTEFSNNIIFNNTTDLTENKIRRFLVRFIPDNDFKIRTRYSILVHQFVQSKAAFSFYETLQEFSDPESIFSQTQPGFIPGNIFSENNLNEKVLGLFEVSSVSSQRIFFSFRDLYPVEGIFPYIEDCTPLTPENFGAAAILALVIRRREFLYLYPNDDPQPGEGPYYFVPAACGDCTVLGSATAPDFWQD